MQSLKLCQNEWVKFFLCKCWELILASVSEFERKNWRWLNPRWTNSSWQNSRLAAIIKFKWEWISLNQIELVWVIFRMEWESFGVNLREDNKFFLCKWQNPRWQNSRWLPSLKLSQNETSKVFLCKCWELNLGKMCSEFKMVATHLA